jgi:perosamine synthetase
MKEKPMNELPLMDSKNGIVLFYPNIPEHTASRVSEVLAGRWIGQGPRVAQFEKEFANRFAGEGTAIAVGSGTDALHLSYILAGLEPGDEVISPVFTCTATAIPLLYLGVKIRFADVDPKTMNIDVHHVRTMMNDKVKAIICVHYGGLPCDLDELHEIAKEWNIPVIEDAAHAVGATYRGKHIGEISQFTMFSFQAIKHITTGDGGMLILQDKGLVAKAERIRWFGIDRANKQKGIWENDIYEVGYKYQMTDIAAVMGLCGLDVFSKTLEHRQKLLARYFDQLEGASGIRPVGNQFTDRTHAAWMCTVMVERRADFMNYLRENNIESGQVHYRNDRYSVLGGRRDDLPNMDSVEENYIVLPLHSKMSEDDVNYICSVIKKGW